MEETIINYLTTHASSFGALGIFIVCLVSLLESTPFFGFIIPAQTILVAAGFLSTFGGASFCAVFWFAVLGSIIGDIASFYVGKKYGVELLTNYGSKFLIKKEYIVKTQTLIDEHLGKSLFIGRLSSLPRSMGPFLAGASNIGFLRFFVWITAGALLWSFVFVGLGHLFAQSFYIVGPAIGKFIFSAMVILFGLLGILLYLRRKHFYITSRHISLIVISVLALFTFSLIGESVVEHKGIKEIDTLVKPLIEGVRSHVLTKIMFIVTNIGDKVPLILLTICTALLLGLRKNFKAAFLMCFTMFVGALSVYTIKIAVHSPRPAFTLLEETGRSFPSGHATLSMIFALTLASVLVKKFSHEYKAWLLIVAVSLFPLLVGFSRLYLGVHWLSDVLGGFMLGILITTLSILAFDFFPWFVKKIRTRQITPNL